MNFDLVALTAAAAVTPDSAGSVKVDLVKSGGTAVDATRCPTVSPTVLSGISANHRLAPAPAATTARFPPRIPTRRPERIWVRMTQSGAGFDQDSSGSTTAFAHPSSGRDFGYLVGRRKRIPGTERDHHAILKAGEYGFSCRRYGNSRYDGTPPSTLR